MALLFCLILLRGFSSVNIFIIEIKKLLYLSKINNKILIYYFILFIILIKNKIITYYIIIINKKLSKSVKVIFV